jgi:hypothetical protein
MPQRSAARTPVLPTPPSPPPPFSPLAEALREYEDEQPGSGGAAADVASAASRAVAAASASVHTGRGMGAGTSAVTSDDTMREAVQRMMGDMGDPEFQRALEVTIREMGTGAGASAPGGMQYGGNAGGPGGGGMGGEEDGAMAADIFRSLAVESGAEGAEGIAKTLGVLQKLALEADNMGAGGMPGVGISSDSAAAAEGVSDEVIRRMMSEFEAMGQKEDFTSVVDNMMRQLLSKDIM